MTSRRRAVALAVGLFAVVSLSVAVKSAQGHNGAQLVRGFECIHRYEGAWDANTGNSYYGGLQMDIQFQRAYGPEYLQAFGTADRWPKPVQIAVAIKAHISGRGYRPWPNAARRCGLT